MLIDKNTTKPYFYRTAKPAECYLGGRLLQVEGSATPAVRAQPEGAAVVRVGDGVGHVVPEVAVAQGLASDGASGRAHEGGDHQDGADVLGGAGAEHAGGEGRHDQGGHGGAEAGLPVRVEARDD